MELAIGICVGSAIVGFILCCGLGLNLNAIIYSKFLLLWFPSLLSLVGCKLFFCGFESITYLVLWSTQHDLTLFFEHFEVCHTFQRRHKPAYWLFFWLPSDCCSLRVSSTSKFPHTVCYLAFLFIEKCSSPFTNSTIETEDRITWRVSCTYHRLFYLSFRFL